MRRACVLLLLLFLLSLTFLSGCTKTEIADENGKMLKYSADDIEDDGFYIHDIENDTFTPVMNAAEGYSEMTEEVDETKYIWIGSRSLDLISLTPVLVKNRGELVAFYESEKDLPENIVFEGYENRGYTIGAGFEISEDSKEVYLDISKICETSDAMEKLSSYTQTLLPLESINGEEVPKDNIDTQIGMLLGLEKDRYYKLGFYDGTEYHEQEITADTLALKMKSSVTLSRPYKRTKEGYFKVVLPSNIAEGYYYVNGEGVFSYMEK